MDNPEKPTEVTVSDFQNGADKGASFFPDFIKVSVPIKAVQDMLSLFGQAQDEKEKTKLKVPKIEEKDKGKKGDILVANFDVVTFTKATKNKKGHNAEVVDSKAATSSLKIICNSDSLTISVGGIVPQPDEEQERTKLGYDCSVNYRANVRNAKSFYTLKLPAGQLEEDVDSQEGKSVKKGDNSSKSLKRDIKRDHSYVEMYSDENKGDPSIHIIHTRSKIPSPETEKSNPDDSSKTRIQTRSKSKDNTPVKRKTILKSFDRKTSTPKSETTGEEKSLKKLSKVQGHAERKTRKEKVKKRFRSASLGHIRSSSNKNKDEQKVEDSANDSQEKVRFISALQMKKKDRSPASENSNSDVDGDEGNVADESDEDYVPESEDDESGDEDSKKKRTTSVQQKTKVTTTEKKYPGSIIRSNLVSILPPSIAQKKITVSSGSGKNDQKSARKKSNVPNPAKSTVSNEGKDSSAQQQTISVKSSKSTQDPKTPVSLSLKEEGKVKMEGVLNINNLGPLQSIIQKELLNNLKIQGITHMMLAKSTNGSSILIPLQTSPTPTKGASPSSSGDSSGKQVRVILVKQGTQQKSTDLGKKTMVGKEKESTQSAKTLSSQDLEMIRNKDPEGGEPEGTNGEVTEMDSASKLDEVNKEGEKSNEKGNDINELEQMDLGDDEDSKKGSDSKADDEKNGQNLEKDDKGEKDGKKKTSLLTGGLPLVTCEGIIPITSLLSGKVVSSTLLTEFQKNGVTHMMLARNAENTPLLVPLQNNSRGQPIFPTGAVAAIVRKQSAALQAGSFSTSAKSKTLTLQTSTKEGETHKSDGKIMVNIEQISMPLSVKTSKSLPNVTIKSSATFPPKQILPGPGPDTTTIFVDTSGTEIKRTTHDFHERIQQQIKEDEEEAQGKKPPKLTALGGQMESYSTRRKTSGKRFPFQHNCRFCHSQFRVLIDLIAHLEERHWDRPDLQEELEAVRLESQKMKCDICGRVLSNSKLLQLHKKSNHETERKMELCHLCPSSFNRRHELRNHIRVVHEKIKTLECSLCKTKFATKAKMLTHEQNVHRVGRVDLNKCENCSKVFPSRDHLSQHLQKEHGIIRSLKSSQWHWHGQQKYNCLNCGKEFEHEMVFQAHRKRCQVVHMCAYCGIAIRKMSSIVDHVTRIHYEEKKLFCTVCEPERKFDSKKTKLCHDILYHNASFTQEDLLRDDEFGCRHCPRHFETRMKLFCHVRDDHQKDCCFQCTECNVAFFFEKGLDNHMRCIEHEKPHDEIFKILDKPPESKTYGRLNVDGSESMPDGSKSKKGDDDENQEEASVCEGGGEIMKENVNELPKENDGVVCSEVTEKTISEVQGSEPSPEQSATENENQASRSTEPNATENDYQTNESQPDQSVSDTSQSVDSAQNLAPDQRTSENNAKEQTGKRKAKDKLGKRKDRLSINVSFTSPDEQGNLLVSYFCAFCGDCFDEENNFTKHVRKHLNFEPFKCPDCDEEFDRKAEFSFHFSKEHPEKSLPEEVCTKEDLHCIFCEKDLSMKNMMIHLLADHTDQFTYVCENVCKRRFQTLEARENHTEKCIELDERGLEQASSSIRAKRKRKAKVLSKLEDELFYEAPEVDTIGDFGSGKKVQVGYRSHNAAQVVTKNLYVCGGKMYQLVEVEGKRLLMEISETDIRKTSSGPDVQVSKEKKVQTKDASGQTEKEQVKKSAKGKTVVFCGFCKKYIEHKAVLKHGCLKHLKKETLIKSLSDIGLTEADLELGQEEMMERMAATRDASTSMEHVENQPSVTKPVDNESSINKKPDLDSEGSVGLASIAHMSLQSKVTEKTKKLVTVEISENMVPKKPSEEVSINVKPQEISQQSSIQPAHMPSPATGTSVSANAVSQNVGSRVEISSATPHQNPRVVVLKTPSSSMQSFYGTSLINAELHTAAGKKTPVKLFRVAQSPKMTSTPIQQLKVQSGVSSLMHRGFVSSTGTSIHYTTVAPPVGSLIQDSSQVESKEMKIAEIFSEELQSEGQHGEALVAESGAQEMEIEEVQYASNILSIALGDAQTVGQEFL